MAMSPDLSKKDIADLFQTIKNQNQRILRLEREVVALKSGLVQRGIESAPAPESQQKRIVPKKKPRKRISVTSFITTAGIIGLVIGLISFFSYAISNNWIGPMGQILIGVFVGLILFVVGYVLYEKHPNWSLAAFGGAIFIEYLSIGFGVWYYKNISTSISFGGLVFFMILGLLLALKYDSLLITYFSLVGGFLIPIVAHMHDRYPVFTMSFLSALVLATLVMSFYKNWSSVRFFTYFFLIGYEFAFYPRFGSSSSGFLSFPFSLFFMGFFFIAYNLSSIIYSVRSGRNISSLDVLTLNLNTFVSALLLAYVLGLDFKTKNLGITFIVFSFLFLAEVGFIKKAVGGSGSIKQTLYSVFSSGLILLNLGIILTFGTGDMARLIILLIPQFALYTYL